MHKAEDFNQALQIKLLWKIITEPQNQWVRIISEKYLREKNLREYEKKSGTNTSWQWARLMNLRTKFYQGLIWQVENDQNIKFWKDRWLGSGLI